MAKTIIDMKGIVKKFYIGQPNELTILKGIDLNVEEGEFVSIVGQSGSGKSTLMNIIGALDRPTEGEYTLDGVVINQAGDAQLSGIRNSKIGFVFQTFNLIPRTSALKNVELPMLYASVPRGQRTARAKELLEMVDMGERMGHMPNELSGGQKQRVAIARAMANDPAIILADEPTGALDSSTGRLVMDLFHRLHREQGKTIVLITHNQELAEETQRVITIETGRLWTSAGSITKFCRLTAFSKGSRMKLGRRNRVYDTTFREHFAGHFRTARKQNACAAYHVGHYYWNWFGYWYCYGRRFDDQYDDLLLAGSGCK